MEPGARAWISNPVPPTQGAGSVENSFHFCKTRVTSVPHSGVRDQAPRSSICPKQDSAGCVVASRPGGWTPWLRTSLVYSSRSRQILAHYLKFFHDRFLPHIFKFIDHAFIGRHSQYTERFAESLNWPQTYEVQCGLQSRLAQETIVIKCRGGGDFCVQLNMSPGMSRSKWIINTFLENILNSSYAEIITIDPK